jgi:hypothetical protein
MSGTDPGDKSSAQIEREVEQTRSNVADTLDTLRNKLQPGQMVDQVVGQMSDYVRSSGGTEFMRNLGSSVRDNPLPVALIGAGIAWLLMSGGRSEPRYAYGYDDADDVAPRRIGSAGRVRMGIHDAIAGTRQFASDAAEAVGDAASRATTALGDAASRASAAVSDVVVEASSTVGDAASRLASTGAGLAGRAGEAADGMRRNVRTYAGQAGEYADDGIQRLRQQAPSRTLEDIAEAQPLVFGALGLALGAALGALLPRTEAEDRLMGETRDQMANRLGETAREGLETVRGVAGEQLERVKDSLAETYETTKERLDQGGISGVGEALSQAAGDVSRTAEDALRSAAGEVKRTIAETGPRVS